MSAVLSSLPATSPPSRASPRRTRSQPFLWRSLLLAGSAAAGLFAGAFSNATTLAGVEPELVLLLRGMALIKAGMALAAIGLVLWRLGQPLTGRAAVGYLAGVWSLVAATVLIWCISFIPAAAVIFHLGLVGLLVLAWREGCGFNLAARSRTAPMPARFARSA